MVNAYLGIFLKDGERKTVKYLADNLETAEKELPPLDMDLLIKLQEEFNISFVFAKEALDNSNGDFEEAKKYLNQRLGK